MKVIITGSEGFIGRALSQALQKRDGFRNLVSMFGSICMFHPSSAILTSLVFHMGTMRLQQEESRIVRIIILDELEVAKEISGSATPNFLVYGGGAEVKEICRKHNLIYVEQYMVRKRESREGVNNG